MTRTDITTALSEVRDAVEAPPVDRVAFQARVRAERRRRTTGRAGTALAGVAAVSLVAAMTIGLPGGPTDGGGTTVVSGPPQELAEPTYMTGLVVDGRLVLGGPAGYVETDVAASTVEWVMDDAVLVTDARGALVVVPFGNSGLPMPQRRFYPGTAAHVWVDEASGYVAVQDDATGELLQWHAGGSWTPMEPSEQDLVLIGDLPAGDLRLESGPDGLTLHHASGVRPIGADGGVTDLDLAGDTLAVESVQDLRFFDTASGRRTLILGGTGTTGGGALSPDGTSYAATVGVELVLVDPRSGRVTDVGGPDGGLGEIFWTAPDTFVGVARGEGTRSLWECRTDGSCTELYVDPSDTLQLSK